MVTTEVTTMVSDDIETVRDDVAEALSDRYTRDVYVDGDKAVIIAKLGGQYGEETCERILRENIKPVVPDDYDCQLAYGFFEDAGTIEVRHPEYVELVEEQKEMMADGMTELMSGDGGDDDGA